MHLSLRTNQEPSNVNARCKTCPFSSNAGSQDPIDLLKALTTNPTCMSVNVIYCITYILCKEICIGATGRRLVDRFCEHLWDVGKKRHRCVQAGCTPFQSSQSLPPQHGYSPAVLTSCEHRKPQKSQTKSWNSFFNSVHSLHTGSMNASHFTYLFTNSCDHNYFHQWRSFSTLSYRPNSKP